MLLKSICVTMALVLSCLSIGFAATTIKVTGNDDLIAAPDNGSQERHLEKGMSGEAVLMLQKYLAVSGQYTGDIDGVFGNDTKQAVMAVQKSINEQQTGIATASVMDHLRIYTNTVSRGMRTMEMNVSAYSTDDPGCGLYTYRGTRIKKGLCAVDPAVIPLGTRLYVPGYGLALADDVGSAIKGAKLDLAFESRYAALNFGRKRLIVFILD